MTARSEDHSAGPGPDCRPIVRSRRAGHRRSSADLRAVAHRGAAGRRRDDRPGRGRRGPGRDLGAEHLALGGGGLAAHYAGGVLVPLNTRYTATRSPTSCPAPALRCSFAAGEFLGADKAASIDRDALPDLRHVIRIPIEKNDGTWDEFVAARHRPCGCRRRPRGSRRARRRRRHPLHLRHHRAQQGRDVRTPPVPRRPAAWAACGQLTSDDRYLCSTRSSTPSATRPASWPAC